MKVTPKREKWAESRSATMQGTPLIPPQEAERLYRTAMQKAIQRMVKAYGKELEATIKPFATARDGVAMDANLGGQLDLMFGRLNKHWGAVFGKLAKTLAKTTVSRVDRLSKRRLDQSLKELSGGLTIKTPELPESMISTLQAATARNVGLIKSIQSKFHDQIAQEVLNNIGDQQAVYENAKKLVDRVYFHGETTEERARLIARDQVAKMSSEMSAARAKSAGITKFKWRHSGGSADPRKLHLGYNNQIFSYDDLPIIDERTQERGLPGQAIHCHTGDSIIEHRDLCNKVYRSRYSGELFTIVTGDDVVLRATPNHPVLTDKGWIPVKFLNEGDNLIGSEHERVNVMKANVDNVKSRFDDFFDSAARYIGHERAPVSGTGLEFHGDITDSYIDVVSFDRFLFDWIKPESAKKVVELILPDPDMVGTEAALFSGNSSLYSLVVAVTGASEGVIGGLSALFSLLRSSPSCANDTCLALVSNLYLVLDKDSPDDVSAYIEFSRNLELTMARGVELNDFIFGQIIHLVRRAASDNERNVIGAEMLGEVVRVDAKNISDSLEGSLPVEKGCSVIKKISSEYFSGHVYNLETASNWYVCNDIITHNCRCVAIPVIEF
jgi:hypothetical protein